MILTPTEFELQILSPLLGDVTSRPIGLCGFGPIAAAAMTARLIAQHAPKSILLVGIAGAYGDQMAVGQARIFSSVGCYGIGAGSGLDFETAGQLGWPQVAQPEIGDSISLSVGNGAVANAADLQLLTVCSAAGSAEEVAQRRNQFPNAVAEDMEGFGVALACALADIPLTIVRGMSNVAGDRDKSRWKIPDALQSAAEVTKVLLADD